MYLHRFDSVLHISYLELLKLVGIIDCINMNYIILVISALINKPHTINGKVNIGQ